jgi:copper resistance protein B
MNIRTESRGRCIALCLAAAVLMARSARAQQMDHATMPAPPAGPANAESTTTVPDHAAMGHTPPAPSADATMPGMDHASVGHGEPAVFEPRTPIPPVTEADRAAAVPPAGNHPVHDDGLHSYLLINRLEAWESNSEEAYGWEGQGWLGTDLNRLWVRSQGEHSDGRTEAADVELLYGRSIATWWDVVAGLRHDFEPGNSQSFAAIGVQGLAPQKFEIEATAYVGEGGQTAARLEAEYELLFTNRLILQPLLEVNLYGQNDPPRGIGSGLSRAEIGLRLRYEFTRRFAPYLGVEYERAFGETADLRRDDQEAIDDTRLVVGLRTWF